MTIDADTSLWGLFLSALLSSTLLPGGSEIVLALLVHQGAHSPWQLLWVAALGNTLGAMSTWLIGVLIAKNLLKQEGLPNKHQRALAQIRRWGSPVLLLSWLPVIGDALCLAAGVARTPLGRTLLFIAAGKTARYAVIILSVNGLSG
ncbi:MAG: VTT domain-containing protein [Pseudomonadota bacterium]